MTYGTSHLLIGVCVGGVFSGGGSRKNIAVKNKNIGGDVFYQLDQINKNGPNAKMRKNAKNYQTLKSFSSLVSLTRHFTKFTFLEQLTVMPQFNMQNMFFFFFFSFFFLSSHHDTNPLLHLYYFRKKCNYILANINSESSRVIFSSFFVFIQWVKHFCIPANFVTI